MPAVTSGSSLPVSGSLSPRRFSGLLQVMLLAVLTLVGAAGCSPSTEQAMPAPSPVTAAVTLTDGYVKAVPKDGDMAMSAIFGTLTNASDVEITLVKASSDAATTVELHEMVMEGGEMTMRPKDGGFVVPAGSSTVLEPGGLHIMLIGLTRDIRAGETVPVQLELSNGDSIAASAVGRDMANADESYDPTDHS